MQLIAEFIVTVFVEILFYSILNPILRSIGIAARWVMNLGKTPVSELAKKDWNSLIGMLVLVLVGVVLVIAL